MLLKKLGEDRLIESLARAFPSRHPRLLKGIGDDTSVTVQKGGMALLATTDTLIEGVHFKKSYTPAYFLGKKSLSISLSDIAAMGGDPLFFLVSIALPPDTRKKFINEAYKGLADAAAGTGAILAGGNTARQDSHIMISTTVIGEAPLDEIVYRSGANPGDIIFVTGTLGCSALGLKILNEYGGSAVKKGPYKGSVLKHLDPTPRLKAGKTLARAGLATAMIDISDGVALDLKRLCLESKRTAVINLNSLPVSEELTRYGRRSGKSPALEFALAGGEDYELLFTSPEENISKISSLSRRLKLPMTPIGKMLPGRKNGRAVTVIGDDGRPIELKKLGFEHF